MKDIKHIVSGGSPTQKLELAGLGHPFGIRTALLFFEHGSLRVWQRARVAIRRLTNFPHERGEAVGEWLLHSVASFPQPSPD
jgi:hypothetical protein